MVWVNIMTLFVARGDRMIKKVDIGLWMDNPPFVGLYIQVGEDPHEIMEVIYDPKTRRYEAYCECPIEEGDSKEDIAEYVQQFTDNGWKLVK